MALNIKNQRVCDLAREAADRFNTTQVEVIEKALQELLHSEEQRRQERYERVMAAIDRIHASMTDEEREALRNVDQEIYDEDGLPR
ncbi:MAG: type II toxin-antitoxin system VapB family antitoxin [Propionibacteriaceae bacterium]|nr:type II toxin-antitoxin system VapB family antitoxin [Propionibacteriaceae bacterium]